MVEYGWPRPAPRHLAERIAEMTEAARYLHGDLLDLAADLAAAEAEPDMRPNAEDLLGALHGQPINLADLRPGDLFEARLQCRVDAEGDWAYPGTITYYLLERPDQDAALIEAMAERAARADDALRDGEWPAGFPDADAYRAITRAALAALRETHTIEPKATTGDLRA